MSYLNLNPANQTAGVSGSQIVILQSGSSAVVAIAGSVGGTTLVDVQSSVASDNVGTGTDALATQALMYGYHSGNDQWARVYSRVLTSGGGFALLTRATIGDHNIPGNQARVFNNTALGGIDTTDDALLTVSQLQGYEASTSGYHGIATKVTESGQGYALYTAGPIIDRANSSIGATVFSPDNDDLVGDNVLFVAAHNLGWYDRSGVWTRVRNVTPLSGGQNIGSFSGYAMATASLLIDTGGKIANIRNPDDDLATTSESALETISKTHGYYQSGNVWARIRAVPANSGQINLSSGTYAIVTAGMIVDDAEDMANVTAGLTDSAANLQGALTTESRLMGFNQASGSWARVRVTQSGQGISGIPHKLVVAFSGDVVQVGFGGFNAQVDDGSTDTRSVLDNGLVAINDNYGYNRTNNVWSRVPVTASGQGTSGMQHRLGVAFSGDIIQIGEGGNVVDVQGSTTTDTVSTADNVLGTMGLNYAFNDVDGNWKRLRALGSGNNISGGAASGGYSLFVGVGDANNGRVARVTSPLTDDEPLDYSLYTASATLGFDGTNWDRIGTEPTALDAGALCVADMPVCDTVNISRITCTNNSGGTVLNNDSCRAKCIIQNESGNNVVNVGGNNAGDFPASNLGFQLFGGESMEFNVKNTNTLAVWAATSGQRIRTMAIN